MYGHHYLTFLGVTKDIDGLEWDGMYRNKPEYAETRRNNSGIKPNDTGRLLIPKWPPFRYSFVFFKLDLDASFKAKYSFEFSAQERGIKGRFE